MRMLKRTDYVKPKDSHAPEDIHFTTALENHIIREALESLGSSEIAVLYRLGLIRDFTLDLDSLILMRMAGIWNDRGHVVAFKHERQCIFNDLLG
jgi:hypothetical protein